MTQHEVSPFGEGGRKKFVSPIYKPEGSLHLDPRGKIVTVTEFK